MQFVSILRSKNEPKTSKYGWKSEREKKKTLLKRCKKLKKHRRNMMCWFGSLKRFACKIPFWAAAPALLSAAAGAAAASLRSWFYCNSSGTHTHSWAPAPAEAFAHLFLGHYGKEKLYVQRYCPLSWMVSNKPPVLCACRCGVNKWNKTQKPGCKLGSYSAKENQPVHLETVIISAAASAKLPPFIPPPRYNLMRTD